MKIVRDTPFEVGYAVFQVRPPQDSLTVVVKATFDLGPGPECTLSEKQEPVTGDVFHDDDPANSVRFATDLAILKPRGECYVAGSCHPPGGRAQSAAVSFRVGAVQRTLAVFGDRHWRPRFLGGGVSAPEPFESMPLRYERAFGGPGFDANPVGRGIASVQTPQGARVWLPNIEDPQRLIASPGDRPSPAGAFPIAPGWKARTSKMGTYDARWSRSRWPWLPDDFDWGYFNAAPAEQQIQGYFRGDEEIAAQNLLPGRPRYAGRLPGLRPRAFAEIVGRDGAQLRELTLNLDTIAIDGDKSRVFCVWRGLTEVASERLDDVRHLFVIHERRAEHKLPSHYRLWFERKLAEDAAEDAPPPAETAAPPAIEASSPALPTAAGGAELARLGGMLASVGIFAAAAAAPAAASAAPRPPSPQDVALQYRALGLTMPAGLAELFATARTTPRGGSGGAAAPAPPPAPDAAAMRAKFESLRADGRPLAGVDLTGADLSGLDLSGLDLSRAILAGASLRGATLGDAVMRGAQLAGADLREAVFANTDLSEADLSGARAARARFNGATLEGVTLAEADAEGADFSDASCEKADFARARLGGCSFRDAHAPEADFSGATLDRADFSRAILARASFTGATGARLNMSECDLSGLRADEGARFTGGAFVRARAAGSIWTGAELNECNFSFAELAGADFGGAKLTAATLSGCKMPGAKFRLAAMANAQVVKSDAAEGTFEGADLSGADLRGSNFHAAQFWRARTSGARFELAIVTGTLLAK